MTTISECRRCGACCDRGGPAFHSPDLSLVKEGGVPFESLITLRKGELAHDPVSDTVAPLERELVKFRGVRNTWRCLYYDPGQGGCTIYEQRPLACRLLKCWETGAILAIAGKDLVSRLDIIRKDDPMREAVIEQEARWPCPDFQRLRETLSDLGEDRLLDLTAAVNEELAFRLKWVARYRLSVGGEMFYFGRPLFQLLQSMGFEVEECLSGRLQLRLP